VVDVQQLEIKEGEIVGLVGITLPANYFLPLVAGSHENDHGEILSKDKNVAGSKLETVYRCLS
jgi:ABC-type sugar transport system ATPase subunit